MNSQAGQAARKLGGGWEIIGPPECPLMRRRTYVATRWFKLLRHEFMPGASDKAAHDHPRSFVTLLYRGGYDDIRPCPRCRSAGRTRVPVDTGRGYFIARGVKCPTCNGTGEGLRERLRALTVRVRRAGHAHITRVHADGASTIVVMGPLQREWGFWHEGKWWAWRAFERRFGLGWRCPE